MTFWALAQGDYLVFLFVALVLGVLIAARLRTPRGLLGLEVERELPRRARVKAPMDLTLRLTKTEGTGASVGLEIEDRTASSVRPSLVRIDVPYVDADRPVSVRTSLTPQSRGYLRLDGVLVGTRYPLGIAWARCRIRAPVEVLVRPAEGRLTQAGRALFGGDPSAQAMVASSLRGDDMFHGVREFRPGDDPRRVHWRTSARLGELRVAEWRAEHGDLVTLVLGARSGEGPRAASHYERAISVTATFWRALHAAGRPARICGPAGVRITSRGTRTLEEGLDQLARIDAASDTTPGGASLGGGPRRRRETVIVLASGELSDAKAGSVLAGRRPDVVVRCDLATIKRYVAGLA